MQEELRREMEKMSTTKTVILKTTHVRILRYAPSDTTEVATNNLAVAGVSLGAEVGRCVPSLPLATAF